VDGTGIRARHAAPSVGQSLAGSKILSLARTVAEQAAYIEELEAAIGVTLEFSKSLEER